jgi:hypothetical protein
LPLTPWSAFLLRRGESYFGHSALGPPKPVEIIYTVWNFSIGYTGKPTLLVILSLVAFSGAVWLGMAALFERRRRRAVLLLLWLVLPVALTFLMALRQPMYVDRYLMPAFPAFVLLAAGGLLELGETRVALGLAVMLVVSALATARIYSDPVYDKEDWRGVADHIEEHEEPGDLMMPLLYQSLTPLLGQYYDGQASVEPVWVGRLSRDPGQLAKGYGRVWLIIPQHHNSTHLLAKCQPFDVLDPADYTSSYEKRIRPWLEAHLSDLVWHRDFTCVSLLLFDIGAVEDEP